MLRRVTMFHAGDELYSGAWLSDFQKTGLTAWHICTEKLRMGPLSSCDGELLQAFCAQTLARLARAFASHFDVHSQRAARDTLEALLTVHAYGQTLVWKQLALALACAEWLANFISFSCWCKLWCCCSQKIRCHFGTVYFPSSKVTGPDPPQPRLWLGTWAAAASLNTSLPVSCPVFVTFKRFQKLKGFWKRNQHEGWYIGNPKENL